MGDTPPSATRPPRRIVADAREAASTLHSLRDLVRHAVSRLGAASAGFGHGTADAVGEAIWMVCWVLHLPVEGYADLADAAVTWSETRAVLDLIEHRCSSGRPLAYLIGEAWLMGYRFRCDDRALVPRSLIAEPLTDGRFDEYADPADGGRSGVHPGADAQRRRLLDLCTGGGSLAIIAAHRFPDVAVVASDLSVAALALAAQNVADHGLDGRVRLVRSDLYRTLGRERFDLILCNPPYVNAASMATLPAEYRAEPAAALDGGTDGMDLIARILTGAPRHLRPGGVLVLEIGHELRHFVARFPGLAWAAIPVAQGDDRVIAIEAAALAAMR